MGDAMDARVLPVVARLAARHPERTIFNALHSPEKPEDRPGVWRVYFERWRSVTRAQIDPALIG